MGLKLHLGCGTKRYDGFINVDHDQTCNPDVILDLEHDKFPWEDNSVSNVIAHHVFEHLGDGFFHFMQELYRVCEDGAEIDVAVPHHRHDNFVNDPTHKRPITVDGMRLFSKKHNKICEDMGDGSSKLANFYKVDFDMVSYNYIIDSRYNNTVQNIQPGSLEEKSFHERIIERNNIVAEVQFKMKVVKDAN